ncbi:MAG: type II toxin-antitoxin system Phd/YefM family antitoxin [Anaerolineales bacterium]|nr:type II toxin-antitoxin system Phd/YefM family antitoxin [Anaerolineales bacterium]
MKTVTSTELQKNTRDVIDWTRTKGEAVVIETYGKPMAALLSYDEYQAFAEYKRARAVRFAQLRDAAASNAVSNTLSEAEALALVDAERQALYEEQAQSEDKGR